MKKIVILFFLAFLSVSCGTNSIDEPIPKMVPDHTPYIAGLIEASPDTTHHYPEIVVGYFTDIYTDEHDPNFPGLLYKYPGIYNPTLLRQITVTSILFGLSFEPELKATVAVRGPLGTADAKKVIFTHEGRGIYGDQDYKLKRLPGGEYSLTVRLPDGRNYQSQTHIPNATSLALPDSISTNVKYVPYDDGTPKEEGLPGYPVKLNNPPNSIFTVTQINTNKDREILLLNPNERFRFGDRSPYLRIGSFYRIGFSDNTPDTLFRPWVQDLNKPKSEVWKSEHWWMRFSYFSDGVGGMFFQLPAKFAIGQKWGAQVSAPATNAAAHNDSTYLFKVSTFRKMNDDGNPLPKDSSDAIGFFGGYFTRYEQTTLYPSRNFDLDSVVTNN